jgi:hypothetical protein
MGDGKMNIYIYRNNQQLVAGLNSTQPVTQYNWILRDTIPIDLYIVQRQTNINTPFAVTAIGAGESIAFGAKAAYADTEFLFSQNSWTPEGSGATQRYTADVSLNTAALIAAMAAVDELTVKAEFTFIQPDNSHALTTQFDIKVTRDVIIGSEGVPVEAFNVIEQFTHPTTGVKMVRIVNADGAPVFVGGPL